MSLAATTDTNVARVVMNPRPGEQSGCSRSSPAARCPPRRKNPRQMPATSKTPPTARQVANKADIWRPQAHQTHGRSAAGHRSLFRSKASLPIDRGQPRGELPRIPGKSWPIPSAGVGLAPESFSGLGAALPKIHQRIRAARSRTMHSAAATAGRSRRAPALGRAGMRNSCARRVSELSAEHAWVLKPRQGGSWSLWTNCQRTAS